MTTLEAQLRQKNAQLAAIREISRAIAEAQDLNDTLDLITRRTTEVMHVESCSIYLYNQTRDKLMLAATTGSQQSRHWRVLPAAWGRLDRLGRRASPGGGSYQCV